MKKIIYLILVLLPFMGISQTVNNAIDVEAPRLIDKRSGKILFGQMVPFASILEANQHNRSSVRCPGLTVGINTGAGMKEYWYKNDTTDKGLVLKFEQRVTGEDFGAVGDGITDNATALQNAINYCAANHVVLNLNSGVYLSSVLILKSNLSIIGIDSSSIILKNPATSSIDHRLFKCSESEDLNNVSLKNLKLDGNVSYVNHVFANSSVIKDSNSVLVSLVRISRAAFENVYFNGCEMAIFLDAVNGVDIKNCTVKNIGSGAIQTNYSDNIKNVTIEDCRFLSFGVRDHWDNIYQNVRFGEVAFQGSGSNWTVKNNFFFNGAKTKWAFTESRFISDVLIENNVIDGNGYSSMSFSLGGNNGNKLKRVSIRNNRFINIGAINKSAEDTANGGIKYEFSSYHEFWDFEDFSITGNYFKNTSFGLRGFENGGFSENVINDSTFLNGSIFTFEDTIQKLVYSNNSIYGNKNQGQIFRFNGALKQSRISQNFMHFDDDGNRNIFAFGGTYENQFNGLTISENTIKGFVFDLISSNTGLNSVKNCYIRGNDFSATNITRASMFSSDAQSTGFYIKDNSFLAGNIESDSAATRLIRNEFLSTPGQTVFTTTLNVSAVSDFFLNGVCVSKSLISFSGNTVTYSGALPNNQRTNQIFINYYN